MKYLDILDIIVLVTSKDNMGKEWNNWSQVNLRETVLKISYSSQLLWCYIMCRTQLLQVKNLQQADSKRERIYFCCKHELKSTNTLDINVISQIPQEGNPFKLYAKMLLLKWSSISNPKREEHVFINSPQMKGISFHSQKDIQIQKWIFFSHITYNSEKISLVSSLNKINWNHTMYYSPEFTNQPCSNSISIGNTKTLAGLSGLVPLSR